MPVPSELCKEQELSHLAAHLRPPGSRHPVDAALAPKWRFRRP
jgi:hypothetical protein